MRDAIARYGLELLDEDVAKGLKSTLAIIKSLDRRIGLLEEVQPGNVEILDSLVKIAKDLQERVTRLEDDHLILNNGHTPSFS